MIETKTAQVKRLVSEHRYKEALQICKDWTYSPTTYQSTLRRGYECLLYPDFYEQLGFDPETEYKKAILLLHKLFH